MRAPLRFAPAEVHREQRPDGSFVLRSPQSLAPPSRTVSDRLAFQANDAPERTFLAERGPDGFWRRVTYRETVDAIHRLAEGLLDLGLSSARPLAILSGNGIDHALLTLAAMHVGIPAAPISPAYSLASRDHAKLRTILTQLEPGAVFVDDPAPFARALGALGLTVPLITSATVASMRTRPASTRVAVANADTGPDTVAKVLFTSGSTGSPKGVINTQRMLCSNQQAIAQTWHFLADRPPVTVDWLPWSHTFGANHNFHMILWHGGTLYIDGGKPAPGAIDATIANLREISPTVYFNVPRGFDMILPALESDEVLRTNFFRDLDLVFYAAAALPEALWKRLEAVSLRARGEKVTMVSAWGSTETSPLITQVHFAIDRAGVIGLPAPGISLKFAPVGDRHEMRVKGPNVTPGYWQPGGAIAPVVLDDEGYFPMGDAGRLHAADDPSRGVVFDGRIAENFKLSTGTWVSVGALRVGCVAACDPLVQDAVVTGHDRDAVGLLVFPNVAMCRALIGARDDVPVANVLADERVRDRLRRALLERNGREAHSSTRVSRVLLMEEPPSIDAGEITDKGYINQRAVLERRAGLVEKLYAEPPTEDVIVVP